MISIRQEMFETNSSSVHTLVMMKTTDYIRFAKNIEEYDSLEDIVFWKKWGHGQNSSEQKFKTGKEFIEELISEGVYKDLIDIKMLSKHASDQGYFSYSGVLEGMDDWDYVTEGDITAFSYSGRD